MKQILSSGTSEIVKKVAQNKPKKTMFDLEEEEDERTSFVNIKQQPKKTLMPNILEEDDEDDFIPVSKPTIFRQ